MKTRHKARIPKKIIFTRQFPSIGYQFGQTPEQELKITSPRPPSAYLIAPDHLVTSKPYKEESEFEWRPLTGLDTLSVPRGLPHQQYQQRPVRFPVEQVVEEAREKRDEKLGKLQQGISEKSMKNSDNYPLSEGFQLFYEKALDNMRFGKLFSPSFNQNYERTARGIQSSFPQASLQRRFKSEDVVQRRLNNMKVSIWEFASTL